MLERVGEADDAARLRDGRTQLLDHCGCAVVGGVPVQAVGCVHARPIVLLVFDVHRVHGAPEAEQGLGHVVHVVVDDGGGDNRLLRLALHVPRAARIGGAFRGELDVGELDDDAEVAPGEPRAHGRGRLGGRFEGEQSRRAFELLLVRPPVDDCVLVELLAVRVRSALLEALALGELLHRLEHAVYIHIHPARGRSHEGHRPLAPELQENVLESGHARSKGSLHRGHEGGVATAVEVVDRAYGPRRTILLADAEDGGKPLEAARQGRHCHQAFHQLGYPEGAVRHKAVERGVHQVDDEAIRPRVLIPGDHSGQRHGALPELFKYILGHGIVRLKDAVDGRGA
mmetsp:Transcript_26699/g.78623  ORF Transcript_26699/g.78623 Transcript_26699/m.78623 type:complete len:342 (+) Transcript_26699:619-1644(+)